MTQQNSNLHFINLPAGSGKTTSIKEQIREWLKKEPNSNILVITYTNRAVKELEERHFDSRVKISTIHSFIANQIGPFLGAKNIIDSYFQCFKEDIDDFLNTDKLTNRSGKEKRIKEFQEEKNLESFPKIEDIRQLTTRVEYGKRQFSDYLHATLSHDDLLIFYVFLIKQYPMFRYRIGEKYQLIIIDECQDTNPQVLDCLASTALVFSIECYAYGDLMQQIFNKDEKQLRHVLNRFKLDKPKEIVNHRSEREIVNTLNALYNDESLIQKSEPSDCSDSLGSLDGSKGILELYISNDQNQTVKDIRSIAKKNDEPTPMSLVVFKKERFKYYGLSEIYDAYDRLERYGYDKRFGVLDVLFPAHYGDTPDDIVKFMFRIARLKKAFQSDESNRFSSIVQILKSDFRKSYDSLLNRSAVVSVCTLSEYIEKLREITNFSSKTVAEILDWASDKTLVDSEWAKEILEDDTYAKVKKWKNREEQIRKNAYVKNVKLEQFEKLYELVEYPKKGHCSTQHGVKGEGYPSIIFEMEDSLKYTPFLPMYQCMRLLSSIDSFGLDYLVKKSDEIQKYRDEPTVDAMVEAMKRQNGNSDSELFYETVLDGIMQKINYKEKSDEEKKNEYAKYVSGLMMAFRIFYVGCSRAERILRVVMSKEELVNLNIEDSIKEKFKNLGFKVI